MKRYRWEIREYKYGFVESHALNHEGYGSTILVSTLKRRGITPLKRPYRVSYTIPDLCRAMYKPKAYGRRAWRCKVK